MSGASKLRKGELVDAITEIQNSTESKNNTDAADAGASDAGSQDAATESQPAIADAPAPADAPVAEVAAAPAVRKRAPRRASTSIVDAGATTAPIIDAPTFEPETVAEVAKTAPKSVTRHVNRAKSGNKLKRVFSEDHRRRDLVSTMFRA
jgi:transcription termination factor Rho